VIKDLDNLYDIQVSGCTVSPFMYYLIDYDAQIFYNVWEYEYTATERIPKKEILKAIKRGGDNVFGFDVIGPESFCQTIMN